MRSVVLADAVATENLGSEIAAGLGQRADACIILLQGELGSGKSTLARAILRSMGHEGTVPSPTYTLVEPYDLGQCVVYHIDLYRIDDAEELEFLGWSDLTEGIRLIEWPERVPALMEQGDLLVSLSYDGDGRIAELTALSEAGRKLVERLDFAAISA
jgi:tRNA threonylcarbamoyladenosine biosynthesis protein TsaE